MTLLTKCDSSELPKKTIYNFQILVAIMCAFWLIPNKITFYNFLYCYLGLAFIISHTNWNHWHCTAKGIWFHHLYEHSSCYCQTLPGLHVCRRPYLEKQETISRVLHRPTPKESLESLNVLPVGGKVFQYQCNMEGKIVSYIFVRMFLIASYLSFTW